MSSVDPVFAALTAPGQMFALGEHDGLPVFANAPRNMQGFLAAARRHGDATFIVDYSTGQERRFSYTETFVLADALAARLGPLDGERVAIAMKNCTEWMTGFLAVIRAGGVPALINSRSAAVELAAMVNDVTPVLVLADNKRAAQLRAAGYGGPLIETGDFPTSLDESAQLAIFDPAPDEPCVIQFTSGTTGRVKGAVLSHRNLINGLMSMQLAGFMVLHDTARSMGVAVETILANMPQQALLQVYPLFHISGLGSAFLSPMAAGSKVVVVSRWDPAEAIALIEQEQVTMLTAVPTMLWDVLRTAKAQNVTMPGLRNIGAGGQALPVALLDEMRVLCPQAVMGTGYGMTETAGSVAMAVGEDYIRNRASAGRRLPMVQMRIIGADGKELGHGEAGEIHVRCATVMREYWNRPEETRDVLSEDGWFATGDIGYLDEEDYIFIVDRKKDMVISGGENIYCAEVEQVLGAMAGISECAAFGLPDERLGERLVVMAVAHNVTPAQITEEVAERLGGYKAPTEVRLVPGPLPRNALAKVDKLALRELWAQANNTGQEGAT